MLPPGEAGGGPAGPVGDLDNNEPDRTEGNAFSPPGMDSPLSMLPSDFLMDSSCLESIPVGHEPDINMLPVDPVHLPGKQVPLTPCHASTSIYLDAAV